MPRVATDDQARRLRYIYLGPRGWRFPWDARFPAYGLGAFITALLCFASFAFTPPGTRLGWLGALLAPIPAIIATRLAMRHVDHDRPLRWWVATLHAELLTPRSTSRRVERAISLSADLLTPGTAHVTSPSLRSRTRAATRRRARR